MCKDKMKKKFNRKQEKMYRTQCILYGVDMLSRVKQHQKKYLENQFKITMPIVYDNHDHIHNSYDSDKDKTIIIN